MTIVTTRTIAGTTAPNTVIMWQLHPEASGAGGNLITKKRGEVKASDSGAYSFELEVLSDDSARYEFMISPSRVWISRYVADGGETSLDEIIRGAGVPVNTALEGYINDYLTGIDGGEPDTDFTEIIDGGSV